MNTLRLYTLLSCFILLLQPAFAQQPPAPADLPPLDTKAMCAKSADLCVLAERVDQLEKTRTDPHCIVVLGALDCSGKWPPDCGFGYIWMGSDCVPVVTSPYDKSMPLAADTAALVTHWPWWAVRPWNIPRPPYPYPWLYGPLPDPWLVNGPLPDPWLTALPQQELTALTSRQVAMPVVIGTDKGDAVIPDFCLKADWESGKLPAECAGLTGLIRKLGLSPDAAPLLQTAQ